MKWFLRSDMEIWKNAAATRLSQISTDDAVPIRIPRCSLTAAAAAAAGLVSQPLPGRAELLLCVGSVSIDRAPTAADQTRHGAGATERGVMQLSLVRCDDWPQRSTRPHTAKQRQDAATSPRVATLTPTLHLLRSVVQHAVRRSTTSCTAQVKSKATTNTQLPNTSRWRTACCCTTCPINLQIIEVV